MRSPSERGGALLLVLMVTGLLLAVATALATRVRLDTMMKGAYGHTQRNFFAAEAGVNRGIAEFRNIFLDWNVPTGGAFDPRTMDVEGTTVRYQLTDVGDNPRV
ncbi:MAG: hypothetical protein ACREQY_11205, partial [Candidatus Binatia bacterium]